MTSQTDQVQGADLHVHTHYSDGSCSPAEIVDLAKAARLAQVAITDHDSLEGVPEAWRASRQGGIEVIPGVEVSTRIGNAEIHITGLFVEVQHGTPCTGLVQGTLSKFLATRRDERVGRAYEIAAKLRSLGLAIEAEDVFAAAGKAAPGRMHVALALVQKGQVLSLQEAFYRYIGDNGPAHVPRQIVSPSEAVGHIRSAGGVPILAHPGLSSCDELIPALVDSGVMGIEVYYPGQTPVDEQHYLGIAKKHGLLLSGGSDFHGQFKSDVILGMVRVGPELVQRIRDAAQIVRR